MSYKLISVKCPECGASLDVEPERKQLYCSYCGSKILIDNDHEYIYRHIDEAEIKRIEYEREKSQNEKGIREREIELERTKIIQSNRIRMVLLAIWIAAIIFMFVIGKDIAYWYDEWTVIMFTIYIAMPITIGGGFIIFKLIPDKENERILIRNGDGVRLPKSILPVEGKDVDEVISALRQAGFKNITTTNLHDVKLGIFQKEGRVESLMIDGRRVVFRGKIYPSNVSVNIEHHGR
jgi:DNA-directed RNA polymerase subunit RPC12/RpoP